MRKFDVVMRSLEFTRIFGDYKQVVQGNRGKIFEIILSYIEKILTKVDTVIRSLESPRKYIEKYIDEIR